jgi:hypothetical protein
MKRQLPLKEFVIVPKKERDTHHAIPHRTTQGSTSMVRGTRTKGKEREARDFMQDNPG